MGAPSLLPSALGTGGQDTPPPPLSLPSARIPGPGCSGQGRATRSGGWLPAQAMTWGIGRAAVPPHPERRRAETLCVCCGGGWRGAPRLERLLQWAQAPAEGHRDKAGVGSTQASGLCPTLEPPSPGSVSQPLTSTAPLPNTLCKLSPKAPSCHTSLSKPALKVSGDPTLD